MVYVTVVVLEVVVASFLGYVIKMQRLVFWAWGYGRVPCDFDSWSKAGERGGVFDELSWVKAWKHTFRNPIYRDMFGYHCLFCLIILFRFLCNNKLWTMKLSHISSDLTARTMKLWPVWKLEETEWNQYVDVANVKGLDSGRKKQIKKQICLEGIAHVYVAGIFFALPLSYKTEDGTDHLESWNRELDSFSLTSKRVEEGDGKLRAYFMISIGFCITSK